MLFSLVRDYIAQAVLAGVHDALTQLGIGDEKQAASNRAAAERLLALLGKQPAPGLPAPSDNHMSGASSEPVQLPPPAPEDGEPSIHKQVAELKALFEEGTEPPRPEATPKRGPGRPRKGDKP
jgi:hypothetical protein